MQHHFMTQHRVRPVPLYDRITDDEAAKLADALSLEASVEDALLAAEDIARRSNEPELADCLARLEVLWNIGGVRYALALLNRARDSAMEALTAVTDEEGLTAGPVGEHDIGQ